MHIAVYDGNIVYFEVDRLNPSPPGGGDGV